MRWWRISRALRGIAGYGIGRLGSRPVVVDTGGLSGDREGVDVLMERQVRPAIGEADLAFFILDGRDGLTAGDQIIAEGLRRTGKTDHAGDQQDRKPRLRQRDQR